MNSNIPRQARLAYVRPTNDICASDNFWQKLPLFRKTLCLSLVFDLQSSFIPHFNEESLLSTFLWEISSFFPARGRYWLIFHFHPINSGKSLRIWLGITFDLFRKIVCTTIDTGQAILFGQKLPSFGKISPPSLVFDPQSRFIPLWNELDLLSTLLVRYLSSVSLFRDKGTK